MSQPKYRTIKDRFQYPSGTIVQEFHGHDYGCCREDMQATGVEHVVVTAAPDGKNPFFTIPVSDLEPMDGAPALRSPYVLLGK